MQILVGRHSRHDGVAGWVTEELPGVAVGDARREFLQGDVHQAVGDGKRLRYLAARHLRHSRPLKLDGIERAAHDDVVANHDRVAHLLGSPPARPLAPGLIREHAVERFEVVRKVVLGQEVDEQRAPHAIGHGHLVGVPLLVGHEVATAPPGHHLVREPLLGRRVVALVQPLGDGGQFPQQHRLVHRTSLPTGR